MVLLPETPTAYMRNRRLLSSLGVDVLQPASRNDMNAYLLSVPVGHTPLFLVEPDSSEQISCQNVKQASLYWVSLHNGTELRLYDSKIYGYHPNKVDISSHNHLIRRVLQ
jgi:hypothetical protein